MRRAVLLALLLALCLTGCWESDSAPADEDDFWVQDQSTPEEESDAAVRSVFTLPYLSSQTLDPVTCSDGVQQVVGSLLYEGLFRLNERFEPEPVLCASYSVTPNGLTYTFELRQGVTFSDGSSLTAVDVLATCRRAQSSERYGARFQNIASMRVNRGAFSVILRRPDSGFPALLDIPIVKSGSEKNSVPLGTGPYLFLTDSEGPCLAWNEGWWTGETPPLERIALAPAKDQDTAIYLFSAGNAHLLTADLLSETPASGLTDADMTDTPTGILLFLGFQTARPPLDDARFRAAMDLAFDRETIVTALLAGHAAAAQFPLPPATEFYPKELERDFDNGAYTRALRELTPALPEGEEGAAEPLALTLLVNAENGFKVSLAEYLARQLTALHVTVTARVLPWNEYLEALEAGDFDLWLGEVRLGANWDLTPLAASGGALNYGKFSDPAVDEALLAFLSARENKPDAARELCALLRDKAALLPLVFKNSTVLTTRGSVEGLHPTAAQPFRDMGNLRITLP